MIIAKTLISNVFLDFRSTKAIRINKLNIRIGQNVKPKNEAHTKVSGETKGLRAHIVMLKAPRKANMPTKNISKRLPSDNFLLLFTLSSISFSCFV